MINYKQIFDIFLFLVPGNNATTKNLFAQRCSSWVYYDLIHARKKQVILENIRNKRFNLDTSLMTIHINFKQVIWAYLQLNRIFLYSILGLLIRKRLKISRRVNIFFGLTEKQIFRNEDSSYFCRYLSDFARTNNLGSEFFIELNRFKFPKQVDSNYYFSPSPVVSFIVKNSNYSMVRTRILIRIIQEYFILVLMIPFSFVNKIVIKESFLNNWLVSKFDNNLQELQFFVSTNSIFVQPYVFHSSKFIGRRNMIWYSCSTVPHTKTERWFFDKTLYANLPIDRHFVWNTNHSNFLKSIGFNNSVIVGPQLFYNSLSQKKLVSNRNVIALMDITPTNWTLSDNSPYSIERSNWFLKNILEVCQKLELYSKYEVEFKLKRLPRKSHSQDYLKWLSFLENEKKIKFVDPDINLFDYLNSVKLLITTHYTSVGAIGKFLNVPTIYFDPPEYVDILDNDTVQNRDELNHRISFYLNNS
jgi:hypothetical protein